MRWCRLYDAGVMLSYFVHDTGVADVGEQDQLHQLVQEEDLCHLWRLSDASWRHSRPLQSPVI